MLPFSVVHRGVSLLLAGLIAFSLLPANAVLAQDPTPETASDLNGIVTPSEATPTPSIEATPSAAPDGETIGDPAEQTVTDGNPSLTMSGCTRVNVPVLNDAYEQQVVELVNTERAKVGAPPLKRNADLSYAARYHAKDMIDDVYFTHNTQDRVNGILTHRCTTWERTDQFYNSAYGENIAAGQQTPAHAMNAWMTSTEGHRENLLNPNHREIGVGYYYNPSVVFGFYWVQDFGSRSGVYPVVINNEAALTTTKQVELYIYREDKNFNLIRVMNDGGSWSNWMNFPDNNRMQWTLRGLSGIRTVKVEVKNPTTGALRSAEDNIQAILTPKLSGLPSSINVLYDQATGKQYPEFIILRPENIGDDTMLYWEISNATMPTWLSANPGVNGSTPSSQTTLVLSNAIKQTPGTYNGNITVTVTSPTGVINSPTTIPISLTVTTMDNFVHIPLITR